MQLADADYTTPKDRGSAHRHETISKRGLNDLDIYPPFFPIQEARNDLAIEAEFVTPLGSLTDRRSDNNNF